MSLENRESKEDERRQEQKNIEDADNLLKQKGKGKEIADTAALAGKNLSDDIAKTRLDKSGSGGESEKEEYQKLAAPVLAKYEGAVKEASSIEDPETRKKAIEKAYGELRDSLEAIRGTQEARDAKNDTDRQQSQGKTAEEKDRKKTVEFSEAMLKAARDIDVERRLNEIERRVKERADMADQTKREALARAKEASWELAMIA